MAATLVTMSAAGSGPGLGHDDTFYSLLKPMLLDGYQLDDTGLYGLDSKIGIDKTLPSEYTQVRGCVFSLVGET